MCLPLYRSRVFGAAVQRGGWRPGGTSCARPGASPCPSCQQTGQIMYQQDALK